MTKNGEFYFPDQDHIEVFVNNNYFLFNISKVSTIDWTNIEKYLFEIPDEYKDIFNQAIKMHKLKAFW